MLEGRSYIFLNETSSLALDLSSEDHKSVLGYRLHGGDNQKWFPAQRAEGVWTFRNVAYGKFLDIADDPEVGVKVIATDSPTLWRVREQDPDSCCIFIRNSPLNVSLPGGRSVPSGTPVELRDDVAQVWRVM